MVTSINELFSCLYYALFGGHSQLFIVEFGSTALQKLYISYVWVSTGDVSKNRNIIIDN